jgi:hypothetical protein
MKILSPSKPNFTRRQAASRYSEIIDKVNSLKDGQWLPVECSDHNDARVSRDRILQALRMGKYRNSKTKLTSIIENNIIYFRKKQ